MGTSKNINFVILANPHPKLLMKLLAIRLSLQTGKSLVISEEEGAIASSPASGRKLRIKAGIQLNQTSGCRIKSGMTGF